MSISVSNCPLPSGSIISISYLHDKLDAVVVLELLDAAPSLGTEICHTAVEEVWY